MIEDIIQPVMNGLMWLLLSERGREWMPFILFIGMIWSGSFALWFFLRRDEE